MHPVARRKGKSRRRIKDWQRRFREEDITSLDADQTETLQRDRVKLPPWRLKEEMGQVEAPEGPTDEGMVTGLFPGCVQVRVGDEELLCRIAGTFRPPKGISALAVGDQVTIVRARDEHVSGQGDIDKDRADGVLVSRRPRETVLSRPQRIRAKGRGRYADEIFEKVIAANMEVLLIVTSVRQPRLRPGLVDRFCIIAERGEMHPLVVFNKIDLGEVDEAFAAELATGEIPTVRCSALTGAGLDDLRAALAGRRSILAGASGVGKSAIVNAIVPGANLPTREIRMKDERGRHATTATTLHELPGGGLIVDTPGVRELALEMDDAELTWYFPEMVALAGECKFNNCTHTHEPDCAVRSAAEAGEIAPRRYHGYLRILETL